MQYMEKVMWLIECVKSGLWSFVLEVFCWVMLHGQVDQFKLIVINPVINWEQLMLYYVGESRHTQNIQVNEVIGESEKCVFWGKN